jgi:hypothetical protein
MCSIISQILTEMALLASAAEVTVQNNFFETIKIIGSVAAILTFAWAMWFQFRSYLSTEIKAEHGGCADDVFSVLVTIENKSTRKKPLDVAFLLVSPAGEGPMKAAGNIFARKFTSYQRHCGICVGKIRQRL